MTPTTPRETAKTVAYQSARRARMESPNAPPLGTGSQSVAGAAMRMDERCDAGDVHIAAQAIDVHLERVREGIVIFVPHVLAQLGAADHAIGAAREIREERVLLGRNGDDALAPLDRLAARVDGEGFAVRR